MAAFAFPSTAEGATPPRSNALFNLSTSTKKEHRNVRIHDFDYTGN